MRLNRLLCSASRRKKVLLVQGILYSTRINVIQHGNREVFRLTMYKYEELSPSQFENLVVDLCRAILGKATRGFAEGPDGGIDAIFVGMANDYPSAKSPWKGTTVIQAKHVLRAGASFSDTDFSGKSGTLSHELPRIRKLAASNKIDHYMLFANRRLGAKANEKIIGRITEATGLSSADIQIIGVETIDNWLKELPVVAEKNHLDLLSAPLPITRENLAEVIEAMRETLGEPSSPNEDNVKTRTKLERKNEINGVKKEELEPLRKNYLRETREIDDFLSSPINQEPFSMYIEAVEELNERLPHLIELTGSFIGAWFYLCDLLISHDETLRRNIKLTKSLLFYMYWHCDLGKDENDD